ncbi:heavy metal-binding domain-containing protein [Sphingobacterium multivorum]|uniref:heavy metal-binding domain-containing protein n=1 Tax=Sphingobacterium multivorum TaxID=28454 RepID=UPI0035E435D1
MAVNILIKHTNTNSNIPIAANVVIGTNIFSDIGASYVDFFGGRSTSYEKKMQEMYKGVTETLKQRA